MTWAQLQQSFLSGIEASYAATLGRLEEAITATPAAFEAKVQGFLALLAECKANLARIQARLPHPPRSQAEAQLVAVYAEMKGLYDALLLGLSQNAVPLPSVGLAPVLVVGALGLTAAGVAWAVAAWEYAASLRDQSGLLARELEARVESMRTGAPLPPSTVPPPPPAPPPPGGGSAWPWLLALGLAAAGFYTFAPKAGKG